MKTILNNLIKKISFSVLTFILFFGIFEIGLRICTEKNTSFEGILFGADPNSRKLFVKDPVFHWKLKSNTEIKFTGVDVKINNDGLRGENIDKKNNIVLCLGDSSVFGWRVEENETFPAILENLLNKNSDSKWQVINAGVPGYSSLQVKLYSAFFLKKYNPHIIIVCVGNNDAGPSSKSDQARNSSPVLKFFKIILYNSHLLSYIDQKVKSSFKNKAYHKNNIQVTRVTPEEYRNNILSISDEIKSFKSKLIIIASPTNLFFPPIWLGNFLDPEEMSNWSYKIANSINMNEFDEAINLINKKLRENEHPILNKWKKGIEELLKGNIDTCQIILEETFDELQFPERCKISYRKICKELALKEGLIFIDPNEIFKKHKYPKNWGRLYLDWCHPTAEGYQLIANEIYNEIKKLN